MATAAILKALSGPAMSLVKENILGQKYGDATKGVRFEKYRTDLPMTFAYGSS
jgi:hypothetical protein